MYGNTCVQVASRENYKPKYRETFLLFGFFLTVDNSQYRIWGNVAVVLVDGKGQTSWALPSGYCG